MESQFEVRQETQVAATGLFKTPQRKFDIPQLTVNPLEQTFDEIELMGFSLQSPFTLLDREPVGYVLSADMQGALNRQVVMYGYLVTAKNTGTSNGKRMFFGTFLDKNGDWIDTVHFPPVAKKYPFRGNGVYKLLGKVVEEFGFYSLEVHQMEKMAYVQDVRYA